MNLKEILAENLAIEMNKCNINDKRLSEYSGVNNVTIWKIKNKKTNANLETVEKLAKALGLQGWQLVKRR